MKTIFKYILVSVVFAVVFTACKTNKNTFIHRGYHNLTARFNGYYYATESIKEGEDKIRTGYKYDYDRLLPVYIMPDNETAKNTFAEFDKAIKKSSTCIQRHTIKDKKGNEIYSAGKWIDNNWNVIGISHFYKREFFSGIEAFEYVIRSYKSKDKYKAMIWLARSYNEVGAPSQAEPIIGLLKDDKNISKYAKKELPALRADYYLQRGMYKEAETALNEALNGGSKKKNPISKWLNRPSKSARARYSFILGQLYEEKKENRKAIQYYQKTIAAKPDYDLVFNARMKQARLSDLKTTNPGKLRRSLLNMTREEKNAEYLDAIYYTLGEICEKEKNEDMAVKYYKLSVKNSTVNPKQKALSYLKLGEISFERADYTASGAYYDSTMITLPKDYKDYDLINKRKTTLETLVGYIKTIQREDSLQRIAKMNDTERTRFINNLIKKLEEEEQRKKDELDALNAQNQNPNYNPNVPKTGLPTMPGGASAGWYFYNQTTISFGLNDFVKKWGNRKLEDNWRRSQKALTFDNPTNDVDSAKTDNNTHNNYTTNNNGKAGSKKSADYYLKDLPLADSLIKKSDAKIVDAYYNLGSTYKEELNNNKKAVSTFEELNSRYPENKYKLSTYFQMYRIYQSTKNQSQADYYKNKLLNEYPNSEYAQIIKNPNYVSDKNSQKGEVELFYTETYNLYEAANYNDALARCKESDTKFGKTDFTARFAFIKAICIGKLKGVDSLESSLKQLQALYPKDPTATEAQNILQVISRLKHPNEATGVSTSSVAVMNTDSFNLDLNEEHFVVIVYPDNAEISTAFNTNIGNFNTEFYGNDNLSVVNSLFGTTNQIVCVKKFKNAENAKNYVTNLTIDKTVFSGKVKLEDFSIMAISSSNYPKFFKKKQVSYYKPFYEDHYLKK